jgi:RNA polymerase sigma factor (TIGR02999 family)
MRLVDTDRAEQWDSRGHFFAAAAEAMRRILVDSARTKQSQKRGGDRQRIDLDSGIAPSFSSDPSNLVELSEAIDRLSLQDSDAAELIKLRLFAGLSVIEAGKVLGMSKRAAYENWDFARAWFLIQFE